MRPRSLLYGLILLLAWAGCDRRLEPWIEASSELPPPERPVRVPGLEAPAPRMPAGPRAAALTPGPGPREMAGPGIRGTLRLADGQAAQGGVLFLIARDGEGGPPLAVKRLPVGPFPMAFEIGPADMMGKGSQLPGAVQLIARIDADGNPLTRSPDDLSVELDSAVPPGTSDVELVLGSSG